MATQTLQPGCAPANPIVQAFLAAHANEKQMDESDAPPDSFDARMAQYAEAGARLYAMSWDIYDAEHGALVALLTADRLQNLIDGHSLQNDRGQRVLTFGAEELNEVQQIKKALVNLWQYLDASPQQRLRSLAFDLRLINEHGHAAD